jgi:integrase/recombinase XerD
VVYEHTQPGKGGTRGTAEPSPNAVVRSAVGSNRELLVAFSRYLEMRAHAVSTQKRHRTSVRKFLEFLASENVLNVERSTIRSFFAELRAKGGTGETIRRYFGTLKLFYRFLAAAGRFNRPSPVKFIEVPKLVRRLPQCLSEGEVGRLLAATNTPQERALVELAYASGLRLAELAALRIEEINFRSGTLRVVRGKGNRDRLAMIGSKASEAVRASVGSRKSGPVFLNLRGAPLGKNLIHKAVREIGRRAGISVTCHSFRHAFATHLLNHGADIRYVQELLGHKLISTTQIYTHVAVAGLGAVHAKFHPRGDGNDKT